MCLREKVIPADHVQEVMAVSSGNHLILTTRALMFDSVIRQTNFISFPILERLCTFAGLLQMMQKDVRKHQKAHSASG